jgi:hypothetical protein
MNQEEIKNAVEGVMAMRPEQYQPNTRVPKSKQVATRRMTDIEFQQEMAAIMRDEIPNGTAYFFNNTEPAKGGNKNINFNPYRGEVK